MRGLNFYITKTKCPSTKNTNNYLGYQLNSNFVLNLNELVFWTYILVFFLQHSIRKNSKILFATKTILQQNIFNYLVKNSRVQFSLLKLFTGWVGGCLTNFLCIRWFYFFNNTKFYKECPDVLVLLDRKASSPFIGEAYSLGIPVVSYANFSFVDTHISYLLFSNLGLCTKKNSFFFFLYLLKNMLVLESSLKKNFLKVAAATLKRKKSFFRLKKNRSYRLFGSRFFNLWKRRYRFNVRLKLLRIKFSLIGKILLKHFGLNTHFFKNKGTLSYIEKIKRRNYFIKSRKNVRFFYIIERRLLVVVSRLYITRIVVLSHLKFLIENGYISVDNLVVKNPLFLVPYKGIVRILRSIPPVMARVPKASLIGNLRWLFFKRARRVRKVKFWNLTGPKRWFWSKTCLPSTPILQGGHRLIKYPTRIKSKKVPLIGYRHKYLPTANGSFSALRFKVRQALKVSGLKKTVSRVSKSLETKKSVKQPYRVPGPKKQKRSFLYGEPRRRSKPFLWCGVNVRKLRLVFEVSSKGCNRSPLLWLFFRKIQGLRKLKKKSLNLRSRVDFWSKSVVFFYTLIKPSPCSGLGRLIGIPANNRYTRARSLKKNNVVRSELLRVIPRQSSSKYSYFYFLKKKKLTLSSVRVNVGRGIKGKVTRYKKKLISYKRKIIKPKSYSFFFLGLSRKRLRRKRHSRSGSRRFFTNTWLVAFIFTKPVRFKKIWYTKLITRRVLNFFCTNFW